MFRLLVLPAGTIPMKGKQVSAFLVVNPGDIVERCTTYHSISCEISIVNWLDSKRTIRKRDRWNFCSFGLDRGWHDMLSTKRLTHAEGWLNHRGQLCVRARCTPVEPTQAMRHDMLLQWLHTLYTRLSRRMDEPDEAEVLAALLLHGDLPKDLPSELTCPLYSSTLISRQQALVRVKTLVREHPALVAIARQDLACTATLDSGSASFCPELARGRPMTVLSSVLCAFRAKPRAQGCAARLLLLMQADPNIVTPGQGLTPLHYCSMMPAHDPSEAIAALVAARADLEARDAARGATPLAWSAREGALHAATALLAHGADPRARDTQGETPEDLAARSGHAELAAALAAAAAAVRSRAQLALSTQAAPEKCGQRRHAAWPLVQQLEARARCEAASCAQAVACWAAQRFRIHLPTEVVALVAAGCMDFSLWPAATVPIVPPRC